MRSIPNSELRLRDVPKPGARWNSIAEFALTFNGYKAVGSFEQCASLANARRAKSLTELRSCLFEQRRWRFTNSDPDTDALIYLRAIVNKIRKLITEKILNERSQEAVDTTMKSQSTRNDLKTGRVIRKYKRMIPVKEFGAWKDQVRRRARGCGLYAFYDKDKQLIKVGLATRSLRGRVGPQLRNLSKKVAYISVFLVTGTSETAQARRIRDLEALLLKILKPRPELNLNETNFVAAKKLVRPSAISLEDS